MMFPLEYQVNIHQRDGEVKQFVLLENQDEKHLIVIHPKHLEEMEAYSARGGHRDDGLVALLVDEVMVVDRKRGTALKAEKANTILQGSAFPALRRAGMLRTPLPPCPALPSGEDLAWAFGLEAAMRNVAL